MRPRVRLHRPGDVAEHDQPSRPDPDRTPGDPHRLARRSWWPAASCGACRAARRPCSAGTGGSARRHRDHQLAHQRASCAQLGRRQLREVPLAQPLGRRRDPPDGGHLGARPRPRSRLPARSASRGQRLVSPRSTGGSSSEPSAPSASPGGVARALGRLDDHVPLRRGHLGPPRPGGAGAEHLVEDPLERFDLARARTPSWRARTRAAPRSSWRRITVSARASRSLRSGPAGSPADRSATPSAAASVAASVSGSVVAVRLGPGARANPAVVSHARRRRPARPPAPSARPPGT